MAVGAGPGVIGMRALARLVGLEGAMGAIPPASLMPLMPVLLRAQGGG